MLYIVNFNKKLHSHPFYAAVRRYVEQLFRRDAPSQQCLQAALQLVLRYLLYFFA